MTACPTQHGTLTAYEPEYWDRDREKWRRIPLHRSEHGVPGPVSHAPADILGLCGYAQAMALAWQYAASIAAERYYGPPVRVVAYRVKYDLEAERQPTDDAAPKDQLL